MRTIIVTAFVASMAYLPVYAFEHLVVPQLNGLHATYQSAERIADSISRNE